MKFNVGDMVACIDIGNNWYGYIFRITVIDTKSNDSSYLCECCTDGSTVWLFGKSLALVKEASEKKENTNIKVFESSNREKYLEDLYFGNYFKFMSGAFEGSFGIVCNLTENARDYMKDGKKLINKVSCLIFTDDVPFPVFSIEDASTEIEKLSGKTIFEED